MSSGFLWIVGTTRSGKTERLVRQYTQWAQDQGAALRPMVVFAANGDNRLELVDRLLDTQVAVPFESHTPLGFFQKEVMLFWPLLAQSLQLTTPFPVRLRPETEQALATQVWQPLLDGGPLQQEGVRQAVMVRRSLDIWQLAALSGTAIADIPARLEAGLGEMGGTPDLWHHVGEALQQWRSWCLQRGLLTYGLITELYGQHLLPNPQYLAHLTHRYGALLADDLDDYPAIAFDLFSQWLDAEIPSLFTFNPEGAIRLGLGADPRCMGQLAQRCQQETLVANPEQSLGDRLGVDRVLSWLAEPLWVEVPETVQAIQTTARGSLLRQVAEQIAEAIHSGQVAAHEVAIIGPGLDAIARYTLREILNSRGIALISLHDQQPLVSYPKVRSLLTLLALIYPGLGPLIQADAVADMLVVLSQQPTPVSDRGGDVSIDPVRAGLLTDHCFVPDVQHPHLLEATAFPRWDRLGYQATEAYDAIRRWIATQKQQLDSSPVPKPLKPITLLDRAIQQFFHGGTALPYDQLSALRELMETAQHYWEVDGQLRQTGHHHLPDAAVVGAFIDLLQHGTITADPYPLRSMGRSPDAVTLATLFQYRSQRCHHRWHFWLDAGSTLWLTGGGPLVGAPMFLSHWSGQPWTAVDEQADDLARLQRQVADLLRRVSDRVYLCHSDLSTNGQEQVGPLLAIVNAAQAIAPDSSMSETMVNLHENP
ncbi:MAG: recombinase family protein [Synechococcales cyanobacterium K44_A2020_017]|nr:recombinase family protein [Synechococcales cyanobacterium K32_A2020_035]MBF2094192.1 recombinase family protein [Synechococcales cyanobacterium K44_A2020_017]